MVKKVTPAQFRSMVRQAEQKQRRAIQAVNREIDKFNRGQKRAADDYNREVRAHNAQVRANRRRLQAEMQRLSRQQVTTTHVVTYRRSFEELQETSAQGLGKVAPHDVSSASGRWLSAA